MESGTQGWTGLCLQLYWLAGMMGSLSPSAQSYCYDCCLWPMKGCHPPLWKEHQLWLISHIFDITKIKRLTSCQSNRYIVLDCNIHTHSPILLSASWPAAPNLLTPSLDRKRNLVSMDYRKCVAAQLGNVHIPCAGTRVASKQHQRSISVCWSWRRTFEAMGRACFYWNFIFTFLFVHCLFCLLSLLLFITTITQQFINTLK